jgi:hypothetical protein
MLMSERTLKLSLYDIVCEAVNESWGRGCVGGEVLLGMCALELESYHLCTHQSK